MFGIFSPKLKLTYLWKIHGYPKFPFWVSVAFTKVSFSYIVINGVYSVTLGNVTYALWLACYMYKIQRLFS